MEEIGETEMERKQRNQLGNVESGDVEGGLCGGEGWIRHPHNHKQGGGGSGEYWTETGRRENCDIRESWSLQGECGNWNTVEERHACRRRHRQNHRHR